LSGHSKWSTIKHKKAALDAKRGKSWGKLARLITVAAKNGGNPADNPRLRLAVDKAKADNMPKDTIEKAIKKGTGELAGASFEEVIYEGYGPGGVAILCQAMTDNRNRTVGEVRKIFERGGGNMGAAGCVAFMFKSRGVIIVPAEKAEEDRIMEIALEAGAEDVVSSSAGHEITCAPESFQRVKEAVAEAGIEAASSDMSMVSDVEVSVDAAVAMKVIKLVEALEEHDDISAVYSNADIPDEVVAQLAAG
jgi:YebC/PmpR family DNA-binding regulatory protein